MRLQAIQKLKWYTNWYTLKAYEKRYACFYWAIEKITMKSGASRQLHQFAKSPFLGAFCYLAHYVQISLYGVELSFIKPLP